MSATFSINIGQLTEATRKTDIFSVLNDIQDNTQKLISPRDVRDAVLSTWANTPFKVTTPNSLSNFEYIGIDSSNPGNRDIKQKILLGKRSFGGLDVMSSSLLSSETDIFLFNTKPDSASQSTTRLAILAGTLSSLHLVAPYIESKVNDNESAIDLNIVNPADNGGINLLSTSGRVAINGVIFPTIAETSGSASNGMILRYRGTYPNGYFKWEQPTISLNNIGTPGYPTNIYGSTVSVNGYSIEFIDNNLTPTTLGGVTMGSSFSVNSFDNGPGFQNWPVTEVLRKVLYPYVPPVLQITAINNSNPSNPSYAEVGTTPSISLTYSITTYARNESEKINPYSISNTNVTGLSFSGLPGSSISSTFNTFTFSAIPDVKSWGLSVNDSIGSYIATASITFINPVYYGFTSSILTTNYSSLTKSITPYPGTSNSISFTYNGSGYLYFVYPSSFNSFSQLSQIRDPNGYIVYDSNYPIYSGFTFSTQGSYIVWRTKLLCAYPGTFSTIDQNSNFKFIF
jgi:hypothetical protein